MVKQKRHGLCGHCSQCGASVIWLKEHIRSDATSYAVEPSSYGMEILFNKKIHRIHKCAGSRKATAQQ